VLRQVLVHAGHCDPDTLVDAIREVGHLRNDLAHSALADEGLDEQGWVLSGRRRGLDRSVHIPIEQVTLTIDAGSRALARIHRADWCELRVVEPECPCGAGESVLSRYRFQRARRASGRCECVITDQSADFCSASDKGGDDFTGCPAGGPHDEDKVGVDGHQVFSSSGGDGARPARKIRC
jgi:hypothetical protein